MISTRMLPTTFNEQLEQIQVDLNRHKRNKASLLAYYIEKRLNGSLQTYYKELSSSCSYLKDKDDLKVAKKLNKVD